MTRHLRRPQKKGTEFKKKKPGLTGRFPVFFYFEGFFFGFPIFILLIFVVRCQWALKEEVLSAVPFNRSVLIALGNRR